MEEICFSPMGLLALLVNNRLHSLESRQTKDVYLVSTRWDVTDVLAHPKLLQINHFNGDIKDNALLSCDVHMVFLNSKVSASLQLNTTHPHHIVDI